MYVICKFLYRRYRSWSILESFHVLLLDWNNLSVIVCVCNFDARVRFYLYFWYLLLLKHLLFDYFLVDVEDVVGGC